LSEPFQKFEEIAMIASEAAYVSLRVLVASPLGRGGRGGIDRVMDNLVTAVESGGAPLKVQVLPTRGMGRSALMMPLMTWFLIRMVLGRVTRTIDLVHINVAYGGSVTRKALLAAVCGWLGLPYVLHVHGSKFHETWSNGGPGMRGRMRGLVVGAARVVVLGSIWRDFVIGIGCDPAKAIIVPNATVHPEVGNVQAVDRPVRILFLGKMGARKGTPQLIEALAMIRDLDGWQATLGGDGETEATRASIVELGLADRVKVTGWLGPDEVEQLEAFHDIMVLPSFNENLPMSVIEGMAHGMAVIATPVGAVSDIIVDGESGMLVPVGDVAALAAALRRCVEDTELRAALGARARAVHAAHLDLEDYAGRIEAVWRSALITAPAE
jgi:glycosyltransferase involved in cell wall biosynthesis